MSADIIQSLIGVTGDALSGGVFGVVARLVPEAIGFFQKKQDNAHELEMFDKQIAADTVRAGLADHSVQVAGDIAYDAKGLDALTIAIKGQSDMADAAGGWAAKASAVVRPVITFTLLTEYVSAKIAAVTAAFMANATFLQIASIAYTGNDMMIFSGVLNFWFLDRCIKNRSK